MISTEAITGRPRAAADNVDALLDVDPSVGLSDMDAPRTAPMPYRTHLGAP